MENWLYCKLEKCAFHQETISFLGFVVSSQGFSVDPQKVQAVAQWPILTSLKQLQSFLGFSNFYRRFIRGFSSIAAPLTALTRLSDQTRPFRLTPEATQAFHTLVHRVTTAPILVYPDPTRPFVVEVDASEVGAGAVLSQRGPDSKIHPCAYFSCKFSPTQSNYGVGDRELLAIKWALEEWRQWLLGTSDPFTIWTEHQNLIHIQNARQLNPRQARWALFFESLHFDLAYHPGSKNLKADTLSRRYTQSAPVREPPPILLAQKFIAALHWPVEDAIRAALPTDPAPADAPSDRLYVPSTCRSEALAWGHASRLAGHQGETRTFQFLQHALWWPSMAKDVQEYMAACPTCARSKTPNQPPTGDLQPLPIPHRPWSHIGLDFVTGLPPVIQLEAILTIVDRFSKAVHLVALPGLPTAKQMAEILLEQVVRLHGFPQVIVSDQGPQFMSRFWKAFCRLVGASSSLSSGYHPQTNGQTERANQQLGRYIRCFALSQPTTWPKYLLWAEMSHNLHVSSATGLSPFELVYGYQPPLFHQQEHETEVPAAQTLVRRCQLAWVRARAAIKRANTEYSRQHKRRHRTGPTFQPGDKVWVSTRNMRLPAGSRKLTPRFLGPYPVERVINPVAYRIRQPRPLKVHPVFHVSQLRPVRTSLLAPPPDPEPPPRGVGEDGLFNVRRLLDARRCGRGWQYLVDWADYGPEERSWELTSAIMDPSLISDFWGRPSGGGSCHAASFTTLDILRGRTTHSLRPTELHYPAFPVPVFRPTSPATST
uniref:Gypsy retrotransposon integrase-like protein 1 n=1 Tax=Nothobranchius furzeri TaxID=105023 RepID=A0A8C6VUD0_NOTFU